MPGGFEITYLQMGLVAAIVFYALAIPGDFHYKLTAMGFGVCHQIPSHSYFIGGHQMPLCARCSGTYLGALVALVLLVVLRRRAGGLPAPQLIAVLAVFFGAMVLDGLNSTIQTFGSGFWQTNNVIRILTGALAGVSISFMFYPMFNLSLWSRRAVRRDSVLDQPFELMGYMVGAGVLVALVMTADDFLYYPLSILSVVGMVSLLTMANTVLVLIVTRREGVAERFSEVLTQLLVGLLIALVELTLLAWGRSALAPYLVNNVGMPLFPGLP
jgi:uncharacterized membrane protein